MLTGAIALLLFFSAVTVGVKGAFGAFDGGYELVGRFDAAGQGLLAGSDVKVRGVSIGEVRSIRLARGEAVVTLRIKDGERVPTSASAVIRPKTLFGEKFVDVDPGAAEETGPFLKDGQEIAHTLGGYELEAVLSDLYPILKAVDPVELGTVLGQLAEGGKGLGPTINRSIVNGEKLSKVLADNADNTRQFLGDLAALSDQLAGSADDLVGLADAANVALPTINEHEGDVVALLQQAGRLSNDVADLLEHNKPFVNASLGDGSRTLQVLFDRRAQVMPLVIGLRQYVQTLAISIRVDVGDGTLMAAVKGILGGDLCGVIPCPGTGAAAASPLAPLGSPAPAAPTLPHSPIGPLDGGATGAGAGGSLLGFLSRALVP